MGDEQTVVKLFPPEFAGAVGFVVATTQAVACVPGRMVSR